MLEQMAALVRMRDGMAVMSLRSDLISGCACFICQYSSLCRHPLGLLPYAVGVFFFVVVRHDPGLIQVVVAGMFRRC